MQDNRYRVVLDTNQIVAAGTRWLDHGIPAPDGNPHRRVLINIAEAHTGLYCGKIAGEYLEKLIDLGHPPARAARMITYIMGAFTRVEIESASAPFPPTDTDDEIFLLCSLDGSADYLVSEDKSLLTLQPYYKKPAIGKCSELVENFGA